MRVLFVVALMTCSLAFAQDVAKPGAEASLKSYVWVKDGVDKQDVFMQDVAAFLEKAGHFYLATYDGEAARVRPIKYTLVMDNKILLATSSKKEMYDQLIKHPKVELSRTADDKSAFLRYKGTAVESKDADVKAKFLEQQPSFEKKFGENLALFFVEPEMIGIFPMKGGQAKTKIFTK